MTKKDLKTGMVVETKHGKRYLVLAETQDLIGESSYTDYRTHKDDLTYCAHDLDIMKVYKPCVSSFENMLRYPGEVIWERPTYYNGKVVCINNCGNTNSLTVGKIYNCVDGYIIDNNEDKRPYWGGAVKTFEELNTHCSAKFIEVVE